MASCNSSTVSTSTELRRSGRLKVMRLMPSSSVNNSLSLGAIQFLSRLKCGLKAALFSYKAEGFANDSSPRRHKDTKFHQVFVSLRVLESCMFNKCLIGTQCQQLGVVGRSSLGRVKTVTKPWSPRRPKRNPNSCLGLQNPYFARAGT